MKSWHLDDGELYNKLDSLSQFNSFDTQVKWTWRNFNPSWSHQIEHRTGNWFIRFSQNWRVISRKKLYGACTLTKGYHHAKEDRICFFEVCHSFAILFESLYGFALKLHKSVTTNNGLSWNSISEQESIPLARPWFTNPHLHNCKILQRLAFFNHSTTPQEMNSLGSLFHRKGRVKLQNKDPRLMFYQGPGEKKSVGSSFCRKGTSKGNRSDLLTISPTCTLY